MKVKEFYNSMKDILDDKVLIYDGVSFIYQGYIKENRIYEYLMDKEINRIYIGTDGLVLKINNVDKN